MVLVGAAIRASTSAPSISDITCGGTAMNKVREVGTTSGTQRHKVSVWMLHAPTSGVQSISIAFSGGTAPQCAAVAASYAGCAQVSTADAVADATLSGTTLTATLTTVADNCWAFGACDILSTGSTAVTITAGNTERGNTALTNGGTGKGAMEAEDSNALITPAASSYSMVWTLGGPILGSVGCAASFAPFVETGTAVSIFMNQYRQRRA